MRIKYIGNCPVELWNKDLTIGKVYKAETVNFLKQFNTGKFSITDDYGEKVVLGLYRLSQFEVQK